MADPKEELLAGDDFEDVTFRDLDLGGLNLVDKNFRECRFEQVRFAEARLSGCTFEDCDVEDCDLTMAKVGGVAFRGVAFRRSKLMGVDWTDVRGISFLVSFEGCNLSHCTFADRKMPKTVFRECRGHEVSFSAVDLTKCVFTGTDLRGARFIDTVLVEADLSGAVNYDISPQQNRLRKTKFSQEAALALVAQLGVVVPK
ncbi:MAG: pentapeptide repeat-containing protein [Candidatus Binatia bacterium]|nr:pentapeptide repeat-containing protein [Candidatus Binatia bacterium]